jgi:hypothetical protein
VFAHNWMPSRHGEGPHEATTEDVEVFSEDAQHERPGLQSAALVHSSVFAASRPGVPSEAAGAAGPGGQMAYVVVTVEELEPSGARIARSQMPRETRVWHDAWRMQSLWLMSIAG